VLRPKDSYNHYTFFCIIWLFCCWNT